MSNRGGRADPHDKRTGGASRSMAAVAGHARCLAASAGAVSFLARRVSAGDRPSPAKPGIAHSDRPKFGRRGDRCWPKTVPARCGKIVRSCHVLRADRAAYARSGFRLRQQSVPVAGTDRFFHCPRTTVWACREPRSPGANNPTDFLGLDRRRTGHAGSDGSHHRESHRENIVVCRRPRARHRDRTSGPIARSDSYTRPQTSCIRFWPTTGASSGPASSRIDTTSFPITALFRLPIPAPTHATMSCHCDAGFLVSNVRSVAPTAARSPAAFHDPNVAAVLTLPGRHCGSAPPSAEAFPPIPADDRKTECRTHVRPTHARGGSSRRAAVSPTPTWRSGRNGITRFFRLSHPSKPPSTVNAMPVEIPNPCKCSVGTAHRDGSPHVS